MRGVLLLCAILCTHAYAIASVNDTTLTEKSVREKILNDIQQNLDRKNKAIDSTITRLDGRIGKLDSVIKQTGNPKDRIDKLVERVQILEEKQKALEENELNTYQANYQSAIINLVSMEREIKPLVLFHTTRDFFNTLTETSNPTSYDGFNAGYSKFKVYIDEQKDHDAALKTVSSFVEATGNISFNVPLVGAYSQLLFSGMAKYVNSIGHKKRELKEEAEKMFAITTALSQFNTDKVVMEHDWEEVTQSLQLMHEYYDSTLNKNLRMLDAPADEFDASFARQTDANLRYAYLTQLRHLASEYVCKQKKEHPKEWKEGIYYQLMDVQALKIKYGDLTYHIHQHIDKYNVLVTKYKTNKEIGTHVSKLEEKLNDLKSTFDDAFEPSQYAHSAMQMYKVM